VLVQAMRGRYSATNWNAVEIVALYWHFVDLVWILVFTFVYLV
jgi:heme/copper-type cytochrome/quinol oxidase subunit 3